MVNRPIEIDGVKYFKCKKCGEVKPLNKCYFHINTMYSTGFNSKCKSCVKEEVDSIPKVKYITRAELEEENKKLNIKVASLEGEIKGLNSTIEKLKEENQYREDIADVLPEGKGHIAEETIQDLQKEIKRLNEELKYYKDKTDFLNKVIVKYQDED